MPARRRTATSEAAIALANAPTVSLPSKLAPQLATLATAPPTSGEWLYEIKWDGFRILARLEAGQCKLFTRNGNDWTAKMRSLAAAVSAIGIDDAWLDCEAVVLGSNGLPNFSALQNAFNRVGAETIQLFIFDSPYLAGKDLRLLSQNLRRAILKEHLQTNASSRIRFSEEFDAAGSDVLQTACKMGLEGVMAKRRDAPYVMKRSDAWLKLKCKQRQEFVVGGFTVRSDAATQVGSLLLGVYDEARKLRSAGSVGTGWGAKQGASMYAQLSKLEVQTSPFDANHAPSKGRWSKRVSGGERWVKPEVVAEVSFAEWTPDGSVRHASFEGLRTDKKPESVIREVAKDIDFEPAVGRASSLLLAAKAPKPRKKPAR